MTTHNEHGNARADEHRNDLVTITVDGTPLSIHRGHRSVSEIKQLGNVNLNDVLAIALPGEPLRDLPQDSSVTIKGGEVFVSHLPDGGSSSEERCRGAR